MPSAARMSLLAQSLGVTLSPCPTVNVPDGHGKVFAVVNRALVAPHGSCKLWWLLRYCVHVTIL